jgi:uncharacterized surface protein with fasciclin (FAS1) repeats
MKLNVLRTAAAAVAFTLAAGFAQAQTVVDVIKNDPSLSMFASAIVRSGAEAELSGPGPFLVFAPTDASLERMSFNMRQRLMSGMAAEELKKIVLNHVIQTNRMVNIGAGTAQARVETLAGNSVLFQRESGGGADSGMMAGASLNGIRITGNNRASNGTVHYLDSVLMAPN